VGNNNDNQNEVFHSFCPLILASGFFWFCGLDASAAGSFFFSDGKTFVLSVFLNFGVIPVAGYPRRY
ncbi:hypothetical protein ACTHRC_11265, partial [Neisseria sp. P0001.S009]|uniref:hypothetical protein n=1 Tax=Neisseria sp. P0001.S009 TaxID=3436653 RepID=UPI003F8142EF